MGLAEPPKIMSGADALTDKLHGWWERRWCRPAGLQRELARALAESIRLRQVKDSRLDDELERVRERIRQRGARDLSAVPEAVGAVAEVAVRVLGLTPHPVQLFGALVLSRGCLAEMATGEGKTLTVALWAAVAGWAGRAVHVITANDYLAARDAELMGPLFARCGLTVGWVIGSMKGEARRRMYEGDVVYTSSKEILADFLKDRLALGRWAHPDLHYVRRRRGKVDGESGRLVQRGLHTAIVDEADNVLIDEAIIPLRISQPYRNETLREVYLTGRALAEDLVAGRDYVVVVPRQEVVLTKEGERRLEARKAGLPMIWRGRRRAREILEHTLTARELFLRDRHYIVQEGKVIIVDEFSGRTMSDRSWSQGLHQAIEAKEGVELSDPTETLASMSFQRFFRFFQRLSGLTGTGKEAVAEFWQIYRLPVVTVPRNLPCRRKDIPDRIYGTANEKWAAVLEEIRACKRRGIPVLVGTQSVKDSEHVAEMLFREGVPFRLLNAVHCEDEARVIAAAGEMGAVTIATNMAGRGTDIRLGEGVAALGGLRVMATARNESRRIDRQLFGRAGRHGEPGEAGAWTSLEDELFKKNGWRWGGARVACLLRVVPWLGRPLALWLYRQAQATAERKAFVLRKMVIEQDAQTEEALAFTGKRL